MAREPREGAAAGGSPRRSRRPPVLKKYGQHFLSDPRILEGIVDALGPSPLTLNSSLVLALLFYLAGNCHIKWD